MPGWRTRFTHEVAERLAHARGAARRLSHQSDRAAREAKNAAQSSLESARTKQAALTATHRKVLDSITAAAQTDIEAAVDNVCEVSTRLVTEATGAEWKTWAPAPQDRGSVAGLLRIGRLGLGGFAPQPPPALVGLVDHSHLRIHRDAEAALPTVLLRTLGCADPGGVRFTVYDPEKLGSSLAGFAPLSRNGLLDFVGPHGLSDMLDNHVEHIRRINANVLAGDYSSLTELAVHTGRRPEPWRVVVILGAEMDDWDKSERAQLTRIRRAGVACGVHLIIVGGDMDDDTDTVTVTATDTSLSCDATMSLDDPPPQQLISATARDIAHRYAQGPQPVRFDDLLPKQRWCEASATGLSAPVGEGADGRFVALELGDNPPHALVGGPSGSGKTNLLYAWIGSLAARYSPDELALYLLDFKEGVSFARFAGRRNSSWLPHLRLAGVNVNDDREFGLAMLRYLRDELRRRAEASKRHEATKLEELREADPQGRWPRIMAVIDEFQVLVDGRDEVAAEAVSLLEDLARRGRSQGIHLVLASQDIAGIEALWGRPSLIAQFTLRIALPKARRLLVDTNLAADEIPRFHAVVNPDSGVTPANQIVRLPDAGKRDAWEALQRNLWQRRASHHLPPRLFDGDDVPPLPQQEAEPKRGLAGVLGQAIDVNPRAETFGLGRTPGRNLAILGTRRTEVCDIIASAALSVARSHTVTVTLCCLDPESTGHAYRLARALEELNATVLWRESLAEALADWEQQSQHDVHLVALYAVDAARSASDPSTSERLKSVLLHGPERGVHTLGWWRSVPRLRDDLGGYAARFDSIDAWVALDVQGPELAPLSVQAGGPAWYPRTRRGLFFDRSVHRSPQVLIPYDTDACLPTMDNLLTGSAPDEHE